MPNMLLLGTFYGAFPDINQDNLRAGLEDACETLGIIMTEVTDAGAFPSLDLSDIDIIMRAESWVTVDANKVLDPSDGDQTSTLNSWVRAGGKLFIFGSRVATAAEEPTDWYPNEGITRDYGLSLVTNTLQSCGLVVDMIQGDFGTSAGDLNSDNGTYTATGGLTAAVLNPNNSRPTLIYGNCGSGRAVYSLIQNLYTGEPPEGDFPTWQAHAEHYFTDVLRWLLLGDQPGRDGRDEVGFYCPPDASSVDIAPGGMWNPAICMDMKEGKAYRWANLPFSCSVAVAASCAAPFEMPDKQLFITNDGYCSAFVQERVYADGPWEGTVCELVVTAGTAKSVTVFGLLPTYGDGLRGMTVTLLKSDGSRQERTVLWNTSTVIYVQNVDTSTGLEWEVNPAAGDVLFIGLIRPYVQWQEIHSQRESALGDLLIDYSIDRDEPTRMEFQVRRAEGRKKSVVPTSEPDVDHLFDTTDIDDYEAGMPLPAGNPSKGMLPRLYWDQPTDSPFFITVIESDLVQ